MSPGVQEATAVEYNDVHVVTANPQQVVVAQPVQGYVVQQQQQPAIAQQPIAQQPISVVQGYVEQPAATNSTTTTTTTAMQVEESFCGPLTCCICVVLVFVFWPAAVFVPCCPCDRRKKIVYTTS